jgi:hypothetical protein
MADKDRTGRGGKREGAGRKKKYAGEMVKPSAYIPQHVYEYILALGSGSFNDGLLHLYQSHASRKRERK